MLLGIYTYYMELYGNILVLQMQSFPRIYPLLSVSTPLTSCMHSQVTATAEWPAADLPNVGSCGILLNLEWKYIGSKGSEIPPSYTETTLYNQTSLPIVMGRDLCCPPVKSASSTRQSMQNAR
jgi:hypothetical protein